MVSLLHHRRSKLPNNWRSTKYPYTYHRRTLREDDIRNIRDDIIGNVYVPCSPPF